MDRETNIAIELVKIMVANPSYRPVMSEESAEELAIFIKTLTKNLAEN